MQIGNTTSERLQITVIPASPGWSMVGFMRDKAGKVELFYDSIVAWRIETKELTREYRSKEGRRYLDRELCDDTDPVTAQGMLTFGHEQYAAMRQPDGRFVSFDGDWDNEERLIAELEAEHPVRSASGGEKCEE